MMKPMRRTGYLALLAVIILLGLGGGIPPVRSQPVPLDISNAWPVSLSDRAAHRLGVGLGDRLEIAVLPTGPWQSARVARIYRPVRYPTDVGRGSIDLRLHLPDLQTLTGRGDAVDSIVVRLRPPAAAPAVVARLNAAALGFRAYTSADLAARSSSTFEVITRFHRAIGFVTVLASSVFLIAIMALKGEEMRRQVGAMRLIGISPRTVAGTIVAIAAGVALVGSAIGIGIGYVLSWAINGYYRALFDTDLVFSRITPHLLVTAAILSGCLGIAAGAFIAWRLLARHPLEQLGR
ncbi:MAG TPA: ABC transporter permease [bacterium]|nr:ABC transporter permease [bacterium]